MSGEGRPRFPGALRPRLRRRPPATAPPRPAALAPRCWPGLSTPLSGLPQMSGSLTETLQEKLERAKEANDTDVGAERSRQRAQAEGTARAKALGQDRSWHGVLEEGQAGPCGWSRVSVGDRGRGRRRTRAGHAGPCGPPGANGISTQDAGSPGGCGQREDGA